MDSTLTNILQQLKRGLEDLYGPRLRGLYLFGSHARGEAEEGSDIDVAMVLDDFVSIYEEFDRTLELVAGLSLEHGCLISLMPLRVREWEAGREAMILEAKQEGVLIP